MALADLRIEELVLQVPGLGRDQAARLSVLVSERLATLQATGATPLLAGPVRLRLRDPASLPLEQLAEHITHALIARLGLEA